MWEPRDDAAWWSSDQWDHDTGNTQDQRIDELVGGTSELIVEAVAVQSRGMFSISLSGGYRLVVFPDGSTGEAWRIFRPGADDPHLVVAGGAIHRLVPLPQGGLDDEP